MSTSGNGDAWPQDADMAQDPEKEKRVVKYTAKGLEMLVEKYQKSRGSAYENAAKIRET